MTKDERMRAWMINMERALEIMIESADYQRGDEARDRLARAREHRRARFEDCWFGRSDDKEDACGHLRGPD